MRKKKGTPVENSNILSVKKQAAGRNALKKVLLVLNRQKKDSAVLARRACVFFTEHRIEVYALQEDAMIISGIYSVSPRIYLPAEGREIDVVVVLGGDGTIIGAARLVAEWGTPVFGVNLGTMGFLAEVGPDELEDSLEKIFLRQECIIEERLTLAGTIFRNGRLRGEYVAINEVGLLREQKARMAVLETYVNGKYVDSYFGDGLLVASPTGSTAYSLSAGGPIIHPATKALLITPVCTHTLASRSVVVNENDEIRVLIKGRSEGLLLSVDGQDNHPLLAGDEVIIKRYKNPWRYITFQGRSFYDTLRKKLSWGNPSRIKGDEK